MKSFLKTVLATIVGLLIVCLFIGFSSLIILLGLAAEGTPMVEDNTVLVLKLNGEIEERSTDNPFEEILGDEILDTQGLEDIITAIHNAKDNPKVKGIYIEGGALSGASPATLQEIRQALVEFKKSRKFIVAYADDYTQGTYYVASVADSVVINHQGMLDWKGLAMQSVYYKDLLDKIGVKMEIFKVGTYKSAVEPYFLNEMSEANKEQITTFCTEIWRQMLTEVSKSRKISPKSLNALADSAILFAEPSFYKTSKLVDKLAYNDEVPVMIARMMKVDSPEDYHTISVKDLARSTQEEPKGLSGNIIAVYYAYGDIVDSPTSSLPEEAEIAATTVCKDLQKLAEDDNVKAVVLRVNSGGGSAYASEQIWHEVMKIKAKKPIIVSMGDMAASGGYYISCAADWIVAEPTTLTGSIGIFGVFPVAEELLNDKLGLHFQTVKTNQFADFGDFSRQMNEGEKNAMQAYVNRGYELFTKRCADGRKMNQNDIKKIAEGRVWTGEHAKQLKLVDQLGSLEDAIAVAKKKAKSTEATVITYPEKSDLFTSLLEQMNTNSYADEKIHETLGEFYPLFRSVQKLDRHGSVEAKLPYYLIFNL